ncbi:MAG: hypothetical protein U0232_00630 [Thermomicrobiales bacterium]
MADRDPIQSLTCELIAGQVNRREFIKRAVALGLSASAITARSAAACGERDRHRAPGDRAAIRRCLAAPASASTGAAASAAPSAAASAAASASAWPSTVASAAPSAAASSAARRQRRRPARRPRPRLRASAAPRPTKVAAAAR